MKRTSTRGKESRASTSDREGRQGGTSEPRRRTDPVRTLHRTAGNSAVQRLFEGGAIRAKLAMSCPNDSAEREADRIADDVVRAGDSPAERPAVTTQTVHQSPAGSIGAKSVSNHLEQQVESALDGGSPLSPSVRSYFEPRFGRDLSSVRVHTGEQAHEAARAIDADAFALGTDIAFARGTFQPETRSGRQLLAHELAHVLQGDTETVRRQQNYRQLGDRDNNVGTSGSTREVALLHPETFVAVLQETGDVDEAYDRASAVVYNIGEPGGHTARKRRGADASLELDVGYGHYEPIVNAAREQGWVPAGEVIDPLVAAVNDRLDREAAGEAATESVTDSLSQATEAATDAVSQLDEWIETTREVETGGGTPGNEANRPFTAGGQEIIETFVHEDTFFDVWEQTQDADEAFERAGAHLISNDGGSYTIQVRTPAGFEFRNRYNSRVEDRAFYRSEAQARKKIGDAGWRPLAELDAVRTEEPSDGVDEDVETEREASLIEQAYGYMLELEREGIVPEGAALEFTNDYMVAVQYDDPIDQRTYLLDRGWIDAEQYLEFVFGLLDDRVAILEFLVEDGWIDEQTYVEEMTRLDRLGMLYGPQFEEIKTSIEQHELALEMDYILASGQIVKGHQIPRVRMLEDIRTMRQIGLASNPGASIGYIMSHAYCDNEQERRNIASRYGALFDVVTASGRSRRGPGTNTSQLNRGFSERLRTPVRVDVNSYRSSASHSVSDVSRPSHTYDRYLRMALEHGVGNRSPPTR